MGTGYGDNGYTVSEARISEKNVDERRDRRALGEDEQHAQKEEHDDDRQEPELLSDPEVVPDVAIERPVHAVNLPFSAFLGKRKAGKVAIPGSASGWLLDGQAAACSSLHDQDIFHYQRVHVALGEAPDGVVGRPRDRFPFDVQ